MKRTMHRGLSLLFGTLVAATTSLDSQRLTNAGEWRSYGADVANTRYAPLDQITSANFTTLEVAWRFKTDNLGPRPEFQFEGTPLMVGGVLYSTAGSRRAVIALNAESGELLWMHSEQESARGTAAPRQLSGRGLAYWADGQQARILYVTPGYRLIALDAKTGSPVPGFGTNGVVDLKLDNDQVIDLVTGDVGLHASPLVAGDVVVVGAAHRSGGVPRSRSNVKGFIRGFDARTGKRLWIFHTVPLPGEFGNDTWEKDSWSYTGNTGVWGQMSADEQLGVVYLPIETPTGDYYGGHRPGSNLFAESLVALDLRTGKRRWHYQFIHHGVWDYDLPCAPILADIVVDGRTVKAVAQPSKQAFLYVLNRETGQPIWPIEERPVPPGDVPGEWYSPTQPFPTRPPAYDRQGVSTDDLIDFTPELRAEAIKVASRYKTGPLFTPTVVSKLEGPLGTLMLPSAGGGTNWPGASYDPETHVVYVPSVTTLSSLGLVPPPPDIKTDMAFIQGSAATGARRTVGAGSLAGGGLATFPGARAAPTAEAEGTGGLDVRGLPLVKPPYGRITAIDLNKGEIRWQIAHGETPDMIKNHPALKGLDIPRTGQNGIVGTLVTKTLLVAGEPRVGMTSSGQRGAMLRAYDKVTGREVGAVYMPAPQSGSPMTYLLNGKQYIVVAISGAGYSGELLAFRLPSSH